ncbi:hypothetical protein E4U60_001705 [Claviceps pazoutovae]|uniref:Uncharacterized protein n=1 Tax=Claviceps pazoutovae TaxID=1649127 RepID=A0A9P7MCA7_9HYPO|nr:hypothetical protein E4U60_001705 [Claviceps pazoutovae]
MPLHHPRVEIVRERARASPPAVMVLNLCGADPVYRGRDIARRLLHWGLDEAKARGGLETREGAGDLSMRWMRKGMDDVERPSINFMRRMAA